MQLTSLPNSTRRKASKLLAFFVEQQAGPYLQYLQAGKKRPMLRGAGHIDSAVIFWLEFLQTQTTDRTGKRDGAILKCEIQAIPSN